MTQFRGGMSELMRQAARLQRKVEQRKEELKSVTIETSTGNDQVKVVANGGREIVSIKIDPTLLTGEDLSLTEDLIVAGVNAALQKANQMVEEELEKVSGGIKMPGIV